MPFLYISWLKFAGMSLFDSANQFLIEKKKTTTNFYCLYHLSYLSLNIQFDQTSFNSQLSIDQNNM